MGNNLPSLNIQAKLKSLRLKLKSANSSIGQQSQCPYCMITFPKSTTYQTLDSHLELCISIERREETKPLEQTEEVQIYMKKIEKNEHKWQKYVVLVNRQILTLNLTQIKSKTFGERLFWMRNKLDSYRIHWKQGSEQILFHPTTIVKDSLGVISEIDLHRELKLAVIDDKVKDAGGLLREWCSLIMSSLIQQYGLFTSTKKNTANQYFRLSQIEHPEFMEDYLSIFGAVLGKAIFEKVTIEYHFDHTFLRMLIGERVTLEDVRTFDQDLYQSWTSILKANQSEFQDLCLTFSILKDNKIIPLINSGQHKKVNISNRDLFIQKCVQFYCVEPYRKLMQIIKKKFNEVIPLNLLSAFSPSEIEVILNGVDFICVEDWMHGTVYKDGYAQNHKVIKWFWNCVSKLSQDEMMKLLKFTTGSSRLPITGFKKLEVNRGQISSFVIEPQPYDKKNPFPKAHTCFNRLILPQYPKEELLEMYLKAVINSQFDGVWGLQ